MPSTAEQHQANPTIAIIGAGFSGLCTAIRLKEAGFTNFTLFEQGDDVGGVWRENTYPGAACDVPWHLYSFSFEPRTDYSCPYPEQPEILEYQRFCARKYAINSHVRLNTTVESATFDDANNLWRIETGDGQLHDFDLLVFGVGQLSRPAFPPIKGIDEFAGHSFHSAQWDHEHDLTGERVAVIGTGASAIQFIPRIAPEVAQLNVFQRTPPYILPRFQRQYGKFNRWLFRKFPHYRDIFRLGLFGAGEASVPAFNDQSKLAVALRWWAKSHRNSQVKDPELREKLTPDYPIGCKRVLFSSDYYPAVARDNVDVVTTGIDHISAEGVVTEDGRTHAVDTIIYGTGFKTTEFLAPIQITGREGRSLGARWSAGAEAYLGITVDGFPNMFMCYGPNTNLGGNSIIYMIECQVQYIVDCVHRLAESDSHSMEVREDVIAEHNRKLQEKLDNTVWSWGCSSWYHTADGRITNNWPSTNTRYHQLTRKAEPRDFVWHE